jgi:hypothetical protein
MFRKSTGAISSPVPYRRLARLHADRIRGVGGLYVSLGPTVGTVSTILLAEGLRIGFGTRGRRL